MGYEVLLEQTHDVPCDYTKPRKFRNDIHVREKGQVAPKKIIELDEWFHGDRSLYYELCRDYAIVHTFPTSEYYRISIIPASSDTMEDFEKYWLEFLDFEKYNNAFGTVHRFGYPQDRIDKLDKWYPHLASCADCRRFYENGIVLGCLANAHHKTHCTCANCVVSDDDNDANDDKDTADTIAVDGLEDELDSEVIMEAQLMDTQLTELCNSLSEDNNMDTAQNGSNKRSHDAMEASSDEMYSTDNDETNKHEQPKAKRIKLSDDKPSKSSK